MAFGDSPDDGRLEAAWARFCERLRTAGTDAFKDHVPANPEQRADAFRFLTQNLGQAFDLALETRDSRYPAIHAFCGPGRKLGSDCADFLYQQAWIDGHNIYRITGHRGTARFLNITVQGSRPDVGPDGVPPLHEPFGDLPQASLAGEALHVDDDGGFILQIGGNRSGTNWLPTTAASRKLFIRQGFDSWDESPATLHIERLEMDAPRPLPDPAAMVGAMEWAGDFVTGLMRDWPDWSFAHGGVRADLPNCFPASASVDAADRKRGRAATNMFWRLAPDEALVVTFDAHPGLWMMTNMGAMMTSMDYLYRPVSYTPSRTMVDADGRIRLVLVHDDPGYHNWIDTQGFAEGHLTYRHMLEGAPVPLSTRLVKRDMLGMMMPADSARLTPDGRKAQMHARFAAVSRRYRF